jgi:trimeric autotransporter adhesin
VNRYFLLCAMASLCLTVLDAAEHRGQVTFNGLPVPGAAVTATQNGKSVSAITDEQGLYSFSDLAEGTWNLEIEMSGFATVKQDVAVGASAPVAKWELKLLPLDQMQAQSQSALPPTAVKPETKSETKPENAPATAAPKPDDDLSQRAADGFLINGSMNNGAATPFAQLANFGNNRNAGKSLYNGGIGIVIDNSALDARPFSLTGQDTPLAAYNRMTGVLALGGPIKIPRLMKQGINFFLNYQWTRNNNATTGTGLMPNQTARNGVFLSPILDPLTGAPFPGNKIPKTRLSPQAQALLSLFPLPNFENNSGYNYQIPILSPTHQDALQSRFNNALGFKNQFYGRFAFQSTRSDNPNLFGFLDTTDILGVNANANWFHRINQRWFMNLGVQYSRLSTRVTPYFENRENVSGLAGILGNNQDPANWGPPSLTFSSGIAGLSDSNSAFDRNQTSGVSDSVSWFHGPHNVTFGADFRRQEFNYLSQQDPRGSFAFTGGVTGNDFADFLLGWPDTASLAFGNADKYFRESVYDVYANDDWRINPEFSLNAGVRWEYGAPITELFNRLVNLDIASGYVAIAQVVATNPVGPLTDQRFPNSLVRPDKRGIEPRVGIAWRPISGSSLVVRAGYGVYYDTSVYQTIASQMAQQPPLSKTLSVQTSPRYPLTLANGFNLAPSRNTFAIDPNFHLGYAQNWQASVQRDLPWSLQLTATYLGIKGTRGVQEFLPNTFPAGAGDPCTACPTGFAYLTSNGNSTREAAQIQLRRRLHNGLGATLQYTYSKSIDDDAALGGQGAIIANSITAAGGSSATSAPPNPAIAQNWLDLSAERGRSTFDQRHLLSLQAQYTTGMGQGGGTLLSGWRGALFKEWTIATQITAATGLPQTPIYLAPAQGTGVTGTIRGDYTGAPLYAAPPGRFLNPAAYTAPAAGQWGNAGRNSITGPAQFTLNASLGRTFRLSDRFNLDLRIDSSNALNHVNFTAWDTIVNSGQFGLPASTNAMRSTQTTLRLRF